MAFICLKYILTYYVIPSIKNDQSKSVNYITNLLKYIIKTAIRTLPFRNSDKFLGLERIKPMAFQKMKRRRYMELDIIWVPILNVVYSMFLGGLIGFERELARKPAGLRTHMLVAGSATLLIILGDIMIKNYSGGPAADIIQSDPIRIMEAIITGISFLGAGTIIFKNQEETVEGLTTAASILFASAIGIAVAIQQYALGGILTLIAILVLLGIGHIERFINWVRPYVYDEKADD